MKSISFAILMCLICSGCGLFGIAARNLVVLPIQCIDDCRAKKLNKRLAQAAWEEIMAVHPGPYSKHYGRGFQKGYADYLYSGGTGQPPPTPPWYYQTIFYQTPSGYQAILDWYAGFRHGSAAAMEAGHRQFIVLPLSAPVGAQTAARMAPAEPEPTLPAPQPLMPPADQGAAGFIDNYPAPLQRTNHQYDGEP